MASSSDFGYNIGDVLTENYDDLIFVLNKDNICEYINEKIHMDKLGYINLNEKIFNIIHPEDNPKSELFLQKLLEHGQAIEKLRIRQKDRYEYAKSYCRGI